MALIAYRDLDNNLMVRRNPTKAETDEMFRVVAIRNKDALRDELIKQLRQNCPVLSKLLSLGPLAAG